MKAVKAAGMLKNEPGLLMEKIVMATPHLYGCQTEQARYERVEGCTPHPAPRTRTIYLFYLPMPLFRSTFGFYLIPMKKSLPVFVTALIATAASAQITITQADMPSPGDSVRVSYAANTDSVDYTLTGPNFIWDFSALTPIAQQELRFETPVALPFIFTSSVAYVNLSPDSLPGVGALPSNFTDYYKKGSSGYRQVGFSFEYAPFGSFAIPVIYSTNDYIYRFPLNYGNMDTCDAGYGMQIPSLIYFGQSIHRVNEVDGWGTLITPYGTFQTVRVRSVVDRIDTIGLDSVNGFATPRPTEIEYKWLAAGMDIPVLEVDVTVLFSAEVISNVVYQDSMRDSLFQVNVPEVNPNITAGQVYPNPADQSCTIIYSLGEAGPVEIVLLDMTGRVVRNYGSTAQTTGDHFQAIDLEGVSAGLYQLRVSTGNGTASKPLVVRN
jgi:hypothetical protein